jgi:hypothetical protein
LIGCDTDEHYKGNIVGEANVSDDAAMGAALRDVMRCMCRADRELWRDDLRNEAAYAFLTWQSKPRTCAPYLYVLRRLKDYQREYLGIGVQRTEEAKAEMREFRSRKITLVVDDEGMVLDK